MHTALLVILSVFFASPFVQAGELGNFRYRVNEDMGTLDWGYGEVTWPVVLQLMEGLTELGPKGTAKPAAAESWRWLDNAQTKIEFKLRSRARWSDGTRLCAQHFVDAWARVRSPELNSPQSQLLSPITLGSKGAQALGCERLIVQLRSPTPWFPELVSHWVFFPVLKDLIARGVRNSRSWTQPANLVTNGAFVLKSWKLNEEYVLKPNSLYWDGLASQRPELRAKVVNDDSTALSLFETGGLDWLKDLPATEKTRLRSRREFREAASLIEYHLGFGEELNRSARCALSLALDRLKIPEILQGGEIPARAAVPEVLLPHSQTLLPFDEAQARSLWAQSKLTQPLDVFYYAKDVHVPLMEWAQEQWQRVLGIKVKLTKLDGKTYWSKLLAQPPAVFLSGTTANYAHPQAFLREFLPDSRANFGHYNSPEYVRRLNQGRVHAAEKLLVNEDCAIAPLYFRTTTALVSRAWTGWEINPMGYVYLKELRQAD